MARHETNLRPVRERNHGSQTPPEAEIDGGRARGAYAGEGTCESFTADDVAVNDRLLEEGVEALGAERPWR
ncbi:MAG: hypothetical protein Q7J64_05020 [Elusimicrobiota bacterium]|nr:hypothetical protein [Elusimicrobiota bacterium]